MGPQSQRAEPASSLLLGLWLDFSQVSASQAPPDSLSCDACLSPAPLLPEELAWPGPDWEGGLAGKGKANANHVRQMKSAGGGGGEAREGGVWLPETWASLEGWGAGL